MKNALDILIERGYVEQATHEEELRELFEKEQVTYYIGFDPTADSLHAGHFVPIMAMSHLQKAGHRPICLCGGGTGMVGDPSGKTDMRKLMTPEIINHHVNCFKKQLSMFIDFEDDKALMLDNAEWLLKLNYIDFLREVGTHFSVNRMITAEAFRIRMERDIGLSFLEFNYMIMQAYDYLVLNREYGCKLQMGGNDQWSNIIAGADLIRRVDRNSAYGLTFKLLANSQGEKMGKTVAGALWLDPDKTSPYDFYQYWRNVDDADVKKCLSLLTFLSMEEVRELSEREGSKINESKEVLAFEVTKNVHGEDEARKAQKAAKALFGGGSMEGSLPTSFISEAEIKDGVNIVEALELCGLIKSRGEGRRLVTQGGVKLNDVLVLSHDYLLTEKDFKDNKAILQKGKKMYRRLEIKS